MKFSINPFRFYVHLKGMCIQELKIRSILSPEILLSFFPLQKEESSFKAREPLVFVDGLEAGLKPGRERLALCKVLATFLFSSGPCHNYFSVSAQDQLITTVSIRN